MDMRDIAKLAGVSSATVSRVINGFNNVTPATAERVRRVIEETRFYPNSSATTLKHGKSSTYGLIIPDITNPFFPEFIRSFERIMVEWNRDMLMATTDFHASRIQQSIRRMLIRKVDGVALLASEIETEPIEVLIHNRVPLVTMDRRLTGPGLSDVLIDYGSALDEAVKHLKRLKHRRIAYIGGSVGPTISDHRRDAFIEAMNNNGLKVEPEFIRAGNYRISGGPARRPWPNCSASPAAQPPSSEPTISPRSELCVPSRSTISPCRRTSPSSASTTSSSPTSSIHP
nr:LacI family DNA-binding transcriptional regulator [Edaphobacter aggregans]